MANAFEYRLWKPYLEKMYGWKQIIIPLGHRFGRQLLIACTAWAKTTDEFHLMMIVSMTTGHKNVMIQCSELTRSHSGLYLLTQACQLLQVNMQWLKVIAEWDSLTHGLFHDSRLRECNTKILIHYSALGLTFLPNQKHEEGFLCVVFSVFIVSEYYPEHICMYV